MMLQADTNEATYYATFYAPSRLSLFFPFFVAGSYDFSTTS